MRIAVLSDAHANLPALQAALGAIRSEGCDAVFHTGDAIAIGPHPAECMDLLLSTPSLRFVAGNHDGYFACGIPQPRPAHLSAGEEEHQRWTHEQLKGHLRAVLAYWPYQICEEFEGTKVLFVHYGLDSSGQAFLPLVRDLSIESLEQLFRPNDAALVFCGHDHRQWDLKGPARYLNPGSLGCCRKPVARYYLAEFSRGGYRLEHRAVPYDDESLVKAFAERRVPEAALIQKVFFGGRFSSLGTTG